MKHLTAYTVSIGILAFVDTYLTATILPVPVWVTFIAWASFFVVGGGSAGFVKSVASNLTGLDNPALIAAIALITGAAFGYISEVFGEALQAKSSKLA
jgi:hypothetical protein